jgi:DNA replication protein DnaC
MTSTPGQLIKIYAKQLKLPTFLRYETTLRLAQEQGWGYEDFLVKLLAFELEQRKENQEKRRIRAAGFPHPKSLDSFDFSNLPKVDPAVIWQLATGQFVTNRENVILVGNPGTGKTHLAIGLGMKLCSLGFRVKFITAAGLAITLHEAQEMTKLGRLQQQLAKADLLILDELSYVSFNQAHAQLLFQVLSERTEKGSVLITTNLEFSKWTDLFGDPMLTAALVDRLTYRSHILNMNAESYRLKQRRKEGGEAGKV